MPRISDLILAGGDARAQGIAARGNMWGGLVGQGSFSFANALQQRQQQKAAQAQQAAAEAQRAKVGRAFAGDKPPSVADLIAAGMDPMQAIKALSDYAATKPKGPDPFTLSEGQTRYDAQGKLIASQPKEAKAPEGFTLSEGQQRFDANGQPIATVPKAEKPKDSPKAGSEEDFITRAAQEMGTTVDKLTAKQVENFRRRYAQSTRFVEPTAGDTVTLSKGDQLQQVPKAKVNEFYAQGWRPYDEVAARQKAGTQEGASAYSKERAARTLQSVDELAGKVSRWTTGFGSYLAAIPESDAVNFASELDTLKANIAFNELTQMREASKTGGALGQVSNIELGLLTSALGALNTKQSPANIKAQLAKIKASIKRFQAAQAQLGQGQAQPGQGAPLQTNGPIDLGGGFKILGVEP